MPHFNPINKHSPLWCRPTYADRNFVIRTCNVMTDDGAALFVYVTKYAAMCCKGQIWRALRLNASASLIALSSRSVIFATEKRYSDKQIHHQRELNTEDDATKFLRHSRQHDFAHLRCGTQSIKCWLFTLFFHFTLIHIGIFVNLFWKQKKSICIKPLIACFFMPSLTFRLLRLILNKSTNHFKV